MASLNIIHVSSKFLVGVIITETAWTFDFLQETQNLMLWGLPNQPRSMTNSSASQIHQTF